MNVVHKLQNVINITRVSSLNDKATKPSGSVSRAHCNSGAFDSWKRVKHLETH